MANQSSVTLHKKFNRRAKELNIAIGLSKSFIDDRNKLGFSGNHDLLVVKKKNLSRVLGSEMIELNQDHKRRCLEKLVVRREPMTQQNAEDVKCALEVEVIDDTALIEVTAAVTRVKNRYRNENDLGSEKNPGDTGDSRNPKGGNDGKRKWNKGFKKQGKRCLMKCLNEKKSNVQVIEDKSTSKIQIPEGNDKKVYRKLSTNVKYVYQKKNNKSPKLGVNCVEEQLKVEKQSAHEKIVDGIVQETDVNSKVSIGNGKESSINLVATDKNLKVSARSEKDSTIKLVETDVNLKFSVENKIEPIIELVETENVNEKDDGLNNLNLTSQDDVLIHNEAEDQDVCANTNVGSKKCAYSRNEMEALRFVDELGQKDKWSKVYGGFAPSVAREYTGLVVDANNRPTQRYNRAVNCGSTRHANPILGMPHVLPLCSPSSYKKFESYDRVQGKVQLKSPS